MTKRNLTAVATSLQGLITGATAPHTAPTPPTPPADPGARVAFAAEGFKAPPDRQGQAVPFDGRKR